MNSKLKRPLLAAGIVVGVCALVWGWADAASQRQPQRRKGLSRDRNRHDGVWG